MNQIIQVSLDDLGRIFIPAAIRTRLGLKPGIDCLQGLVAYVGRRERGHAAPTLAHNGLEGGEGPRGAGQARTTPAKGAGSVAAGAGRLGPRVLPRLARRDRHRILEPGMHVPEVLVACLACRVFGHARPTPADDVGDVTDGQRRVGEGRAAGAALGIDPMAAHAG